MLAYITQRMRRYKKALFARNSSLRIQCETGNCFVALRGRYDIQNFANSDNKTNFREKKATVLIYFAFCKWLFHKEDNFLFRPTEPLAFHATIIPDPWKISSVPSVPGGGGSKLFLRIKTLSTAGEIAFSDDTGGGTGSTGFL